MARLLIFLRSCGSYSRLDTSNVSFTLKVFRYKCKFVYTFTRRIHHRDIKCATDNSLISLSRIHRNAGILVFMSRAKRIAFVSRTRNSYWKHFTSSGPSVCHLKVRTSDVLVVERRRRTSLMAGPIVMTDIYLMFA